MWAKKAGSNFVILLGSILSRWPLTPAKITATWSSIGMGTGKRMQNLLHNLAIILKMNLWHLHLVYEQQYDCTTIITAATNSFGDWWLRLSLKLFIDWRWNQPQLYWRTTAFCDSAIEVARRQISNKIIQTKNQLQEELSSLAPVGRISDTLGWDPASGQCKTTRAK